MMRKSYFIALVIAAMIFTIIFAYIQNSKVDEKYCEKDDDCACGRNIRTGECFYGNKNFVNVSDQCPDFCTGIHGHFVIRCINNECKQAFE